MRLSTALTLETTAEINQFANWLLDVGDGNLSLPNDGMAEIEIPPELLITKYYNPLEAIVNSTYPDLLQHLSDSKYFNDRAILAPTIETVNQLNDYMCSLLPGQPVDYFSADSVPKIEQDNDSIDDLYTTEFLNTINCSGLPPHKLTLKIGTPVMLLRNIDQASGLCNGTRLRITFLGKHVLKATTLNGTNANNEVLLHRMDMNPSETKLPFLMQRRQFPIILSFAMTINKSQGQSLQHVGLYLPKPVFSHGQLYVALSRVKSRKGLHILIHDSNQQPRSSTLNVVFKEIFCNLDSKSFS
ncbi:uncharacterized protein LOC129285554 [Prosopis cineraria]|uniref:uncharacterized protein LOC129285551 n=1 Tax=Prosopis cineraria TaxID=364024 RepID=UPI0024102A6A|nr:uncharacterized protein LOC129285551 [Prosopis cineraria]XP_054777265.1 uncharacterized protein LOC129285554 [Prosopis cineraria]